MRTRTVREAKAQLSELLRNIDEERVLITNHGRPVAVIVEVGNLDLTEIVYQYDEKFRRSLERAEKGPFMSIEELRARYGIPEPASAPKRRTSKRAEGKPVAAKALRRRPT